MKVLEVIEKIEKEAVENKERSNKIKGIRMINDINVNQVIRQGDIYITRVKKDHDIGKKVDTRQLVEGFSAGSRHVLVGDDIKVYDGIKHPEAVNTIYPLGYAFDYEKGNCVITHPEHDNIVINVPGRYQVTQQMDWKTKQRVLD